MGQRRQNSVDEGFMQLALNQAQKGLGCTRPNPAVGAVIVVAGKVVARGYHAAAGKPHAEVEALKKARQSVAGATMYVTLEPCNHVGKTGPCTKAIIQAGIARVVIGCRDPNPQVSGRGVAVLRRAGIRVQTGILRQQCLQLIAGFAKHKRTGRPLIILKAATSLDGRLATWRGVSSGLTGTVAHQHLHQLRANCDGILVGRKTVQADNPRLTVRGRADRKKNNPLVRIVVDTHARTPSGAKVITGPGRVIIACTKQAPVARRRRLEKAGAEILVCREKRSFVSLADLFGRLGRLGLMTILVEGGGQIHGSLVREGLADRAMIYVAPRLIGGDGVPLLAGKGVATLQNTALHNVCWLPLGEDMLLTGDF